MADRSRVSQSIPKAKSYATRTNNYLQKVIVPTNGHRLGLTDQNILDWAEHEAIIAALYLKWCDKSIKNQIINKDIREAIIAFKKFTRPLLNIIAASTILTNTDEAIFNLIGDSKHKKPTHRTKKIIEPIFATIEAIGGGDIIHHCRTMAASMRNHLFDEADGVEVAYFLSDKPETLLDPSKCLTKTFTKATFLQELGAENAGKYINHMHRWVYSKNTKLNGSYSASRSNLLL